MNNHKFLTILILCLIGLCTIFSLSIYQIMVRQCWLWTCVPSRAFSVLDLDLPTHLLPDNVVVNPMSIPSEPEGIESGNFAFYWEESEALYGGGLDVDRYGTITKARESFESSLYWRNRGTYEPHPKITYESPIADEFLIGCGSSMFDNGYECSLSARYQEYLVDFNSSISEKLTESQFEQIVKDVDQRMMFFLGQ